jgi:hypothetical protein
MVTRGSVYNVFMAIEEPERPIKLRVKQLMMMPTPEFAGVAPIKSFATIGEFYDAIKEKIRTFGDGIFKQPSSPQVIDNTWFPADQMFPVTNVERACEAIDVIVEQGEGTTTSPLEGQDGEPAHYYGRLLVRDPDTKEGYSYSGAAVPLNPAGVWNLYPDAKVVDYEPDSRAYNLVQRFNYSYTTLLRALHQTFNGTPDNLKRAMGVMYELKLLANEVVSTPIRDTGYTGAPTFEYTTLPL